MKRRLVLIVSLLCLASLMAAMAFNSGKITNVASLKVSATDKSLIAIVPGDYREVGNKDQTATVGRDGILHIDFGKSLCANPGLQPNSEYTWNNLFGIKNNSQEKVKIDLDVKGVFEEYIEIYADGHKIYPASRHHNNKLVLDSGRSQDLKVVVKLPKDAKLGTFEGSIVVNAEAIKSGR